MHAAKEPRVRHSPRPRERTSKARRACVRCTLVLVLISCQTVEGTPDQSTDCEQPVASYCAAQREGCPASAAHVDLCAWMARRGIPRERVYGAPASCGSDIEVFHFDEGDTERRYFFAKDGLFAVLESSRLDPLRGHCLGGPKRIQTLTCVDFKYITPSCVVDAGTD